MTAADGRTDAELVAESLSGNRDAFGQIVARYQSLICALIGRQLSAALTEVPDPQRMKSQMPAGMTLAMLEGNLGLPAGMNGHR